MLTDTGTNSTHKSGKGEQDFELNLAPIIDCLVVLITYLLVSTSFIIIAVLDVSTAIPAPADQITANDIPNLMLKIDLAGDHTLGISLVGSTNVSFSIPPVNGTWNLDLLVSTLKPLREKFQDLTIANISADPLVEYKQVVHAVEAAKQVMPVVYLGER